MKNHKIYKVMSHEVRKISTKFPYSFKFSTNKTTYPYKFGGIRLELELFPHFHWIERFFGKDTLEGFKEAYLSILDALMRKDK
jgi:hypothetical protein